MFFRWCKDGSGDGPSSGAPEFGGTRHPAQQASKQQAASSKQESGEKATKKKKN